MEIKQTKKEEASPSQARELYREDLMVSNFEDFKYAVKLGRTIQKAYGEEPVAPEDLAQVYSDYIRLKLMCE